MSHADRILATIKRGPVSGPQLIERLNVGNTIYAILAKLEADGAIQCIRGDGSRADPKVWRAVKVIAP